MTSQDQCREQFEAWAETHGLCMDELSMSSSGVPTNPFVDNDTRQFYAAWLAAWSVARSIPAPPSAISKMDAIDAARYRFLRDKEGCRVLDEWLHGKRLDDAIDAELFGAAATKGDSRESLLHETKTPSASMEASTAPLTHQEIFSAVHHHVSEIFRLTAAVPAQCTGLGERDE